MSASNDLKKGVPVVVLDVGNDIVVHTGLIGNTKLSSRNNNAVARARVVGKYIDEEIQVSDPRFLTKEEAVELRDPEKAAVWYEPYFSRSTTNKIAQILSDISLQM